MALVPNTKSATYKALEMKWAKIQTCLNGEEAIKAAGELYLPKLSGQTPKEYASYKDRGSFFNAFNRTVGGLVGAIMRKPPAVTSSAKVEAILPTVTLANESIEEVIRMVTEAIISYGYFGILVDMAPVVPGQAVSPNPYFALYSCDAILNFQVVQEGSEDKLMMLALAEFIEVPSQANELEMVKVDRVRLLKIEEGLLVVRLYEKDMTASKKKEVWKQVGNDMQPVIRGARMDYIPFVFFGSNSNNPVPTNPPLLDLVNLNIKHWQVSTDFYHGLHYCAIPTPWAAGFPASAELYLGALKAWVSEQPEARCGFLEFTGQGLTAVSNAIDKLERQMAIMGARMLEEQKKAVEAADTLEMRYSSDSATLSNIVTSVEQGILKAILLLGKWISIEETTATVKLNRDFVSQKLGAQDIAALVSAYQASTISLDTFLYNLAVGERLSPDTTIKEEKAKIEVEKESRPAFTPGFGSNFVPGGDGNPAGEDQE